MMNNTKIIVLYIHNMKKKHREKDIYLAVLDRESPKPDNKIILLNQRKSHEQTHKKKKETNKGQIHC